MLVPGTESSKQAVGTTASTALRTIPYMPNELPHVTEGAAQVDHQLIRAMGVPTLTANIVNSTIGAGIFVLPAAMAKGLGAAAPLAFLCCAIAMILFVTCFAIAGSRVSLTGGLYAYVEVAFGPYVGFLAGILYCLTAICAVAGIVNVFVSSIASIVPALNNPALRIAVMALVYGVLVVINVRGVREGAGAVTVVTLAKLLPILLFVGVGVFFIHPSNLGWSVWPTSNSLGENVVLLMFAFVGIEVALIPSGEVKNPARTVPRSIYLALAITTVVYVMIQVVGQGTLGADLAKYEDAPLAEAALIFLGPIGRTILLAGATLSAFGFVTSDILSSPRMIFALGRDGSILIFSKWFAHVHRRYRTPDIAIYTYSLLAFILSVTGSFKQLALLSNVAVLLMYLLCFAACLLLLRRDTQGQQVFSFPGMKIVPVLAMIAAIWILAHATRREFAINGLVLLVASLLYALNVLFKRRSA